MTEHDALVQIQAIATQALGTPVPTPSPSPSPGPTPTPSPPGEQGAPWTTPWHSGDIYGPFPPGGLKVSSPDFSPEGYTDPISFSVGGAYSNPQLNVIDNSTGLSVHYGWGNPWTAKDPNGTYHLEVTFYAPDRMTVLLVHP